MDKKQYSEEWTDKIRPAILLRDNFKCQDCGVRHLKYVHRNTNGVWHYIEPDEYAEMQPHKLRVYRVYLQVAHLNCDKNNNNPDNLRTLCLWCHLKFDKSHKLLMRLAQKKSKLS